jgi:hypothetical protein
MLIRDVLILAISCTYCFLIGSSAPTSRARFWPTFISGRGEPGALPEGRLNKWVGTEGWNWSEGGEIETRIHSLRHECRSTDGIDSTMRYAGRRRRSRWHGSIQYHWKGTGEATVNDSLTGLMGSTGRLLVRRVFLRRPMFVGEFRNAWRYSSWTDRIDMMSDISGDRGTFVIWWGSSHGVYKIIKVDEMW